MIEKLKRIKVKNAIRYVVMFAALCVFSYSAYELTNIYLGYKEGSDVYQKMEEQFFVPSVSGNSEQQTDSNGILFTNNSNGTQDVFDFDALKNFNHDAIGWIKLDDGEYINYPIVQAEDNDKYLRTLITMKYNISGTIFVDYRCEGGLEARNAVVYGHNMNDKSMFGSLRYYYNEKNYYKSHPYFDIWVGSTHYRYYVYSVYHTDRVGSSTYQFSFESDEDFLDYVQSHKAESIVDIDVGEITAEDHIATFSTCVYGEEERRLIIQLVRREVVDDATGTVVEG